MDFIEGKALEEYLNSAKGGHLAVEGVSLRRAVTRPCRYGKHHNHSLLLSQNWMVENPGATHFRRGMARRSDGRSNSRSICMRSASRIRRYCSSRSERDACLGGGS